MILNAPLESLKLVLVLALLVTSGCGENQGTQTKPTKELVPQEITSRNTSMHTEREKYLQENIAKISQENFPDNLKNTWKILSFVHKNTQTYVEVEPEPKDVGYDKFVYVMDYSKRGQLPACVGGYSWTAGQYSLLFSAGDEKLPKTITMK
jgi:hypothetical protein